jgi:hypothetical protein
MAKKPPRSAQRRVPKTVLRLPDLTTYVSRDIQFLGTVSMSGAIAPRLEKGANQLGVKVKENDGT